MLPGPDEIDQRRSLAQAVKRIQFVTGRQVSDVMAGAYLSVFKGRGMEFDEVRPYAPGADGRAVELSALLAMSAVENGDKVGLLLFHGGADLYIPPRKGGKHSLRIVREVLARGENAAAGPADRSVLP